MRPPSRRDRRWGRSDPSAPNRSIRAAAHRARTGRSRSPSRSTPFPNRIVWTGALRQGACPSILAATHDEGERMAIKRVGVVGFGLMGSGIAQVCAQAGYDTVVREVGQPFLDTGFGRVDSSLARVVKSGKMTEADAKAARGRMRGTTALEDLRDCDLVIEAVIEEMSAKQQVFGTLDRICPATTIFVSNTSSLTIVEMAASTKRPDRFAGLHFFSPAQIMPLVEIVQALTTSDETVATLRGFVTSLGKTGVVCKDTPGFIVNRLLVPYLLGAIRALEQGVA